MTAHREHGTQPVGELATKAPTVPNSDTGPASWPQRRRPPRATSRPRSWAHLKRGRPRPSSDTNDLEAGLAIGGIEGVAKMGLYYFHERGWNYAIERRSGPEPAARKAEGGACYSGRGRRSITIGRSPRSRCIST